MWKTRKRGENEGAGGKKIVGLRRKGKVREREGSG